MFMRSGVHACFEMMPLLFCEECQKQARFFPVKYVTGIFGASRSTLYHWMDRRWIHWRKLPNSRRIICTESMSRRSTDAA